MQQLSSLTLIAWSVWLWSGWQSRGLMQSWLETPFDGLAWLAFSLWILAALHSLLRSGFRQDSNLSPRQNTHGEAIILLAVFLITVGQAADLRVCFHTSFSLATAVTCVQSVGGRKLIWLLSACSWMPALGWLFHGSNTQVVALLRLVLATAGVLAIIRFRDYTPRFIWRAPS